MLARVVGPAQSAELLPGVVVGGDFRVVQPLSAGGMGAVYVAEQLSTGKRRALKVMHPSLVVDPGLRERFAQEARVGSLVQSDHVVQVVGAGVDPVLGAPWLAMELLEGENLASYVARRGPLGPHELFDILRPVCHALGAAHAAGVVHRDVKPENVFLARTQSTAAPEVVKVLDFGIAKLIAQAQATQTSMMGTPLWMAPEQSDTLGRISPATDVWAVGLMAFWLLTGRHYWKSASHSNASVHALLREILFEPVSAPSARVAELGLPMVLPAGFDAWFLRCLAREPSQRFPDAHQAMQALESPASSAPLPSSPSLQAPAPSTPDRTKRSVAGLVLGLGAAALVVVLLGFGGAAVWYFGLREPPTPSATAGATATGSALAAPLAPTPAVSTESAASARPVTLGKPPSQAGGASSAGPSASAAAPPGKPFDAVAASNAIQLKTSQAKFACKNMDGPSTVTGKISYSNSGRAIAMTDGMPSARSTCVGSIMSGAGVQPFVGKAPTLTFAVSF